LKPTVLFFIFSTICFSQVRPHVYGSATSNHDTLVARAFILGYQSTGGTWNGTITYGYISRVTALTNERNLYIKSYTGFITDTAASNSAYQSGLLSIMPTGSNSSIFLWDSDGDLPSQISVGAGTDSNITAYDIEFFGIDPFFTPALSSYSNGYIAGQLSFIKDSLNCSWWAARYRARKTGTDTIWSGKNGYGKINVIAAINYSQNIPNDPYVSIQLPPPPPPDPDPIPAYYVPVSILRQQPWFKPPSF
jgi:hypothetical protein